MGAVQPRKTMHVQSLTQLEASKSINKINYLYMILPTAGLAATLKISSIISEVTAVNLLLQPRLPYNRLPSQSSPSFFVFPKTTSTIFFDDFNFNTSSTLIKAHSMNFNIIVEHQDTGPTTEYSTSHINFKRLLLLENSSPYDQHIINEPTKTSR